MKATRSERNETKKRLRIARGWNSTNTKTERKIRATIIIDR